MADTQPNTNTQNTPAVKPMDDIVALCRRRGFIFQSSELYGGINGFWDYGPLGAQLKRNLKNAWWQDLVDCPPDGPDGEPLSIVPVDTTIIMHPEVWTASGHVAGFNDPMVDDKETKQRFRADHFVGAWISTWNSDPADEQKREDRFFSPDKIIKTVVANSVHEAASLLQNNPKLLKPYKLTSEFRPHANDDINALLATIEDKNGNRGQIQLEVIAYDELRNQPEQILSPFTDKAGSLTEPRDFNLMFETYVGALRDEDSRSYLRPETAQGIFTQFWNVVDSSRVRVPFGIAQQGKAFRNEVTPRNFTFRSREFEQMEIEFFIPDPEAMQEGDLTAEDWYKHWRDLRYRWWQSVGLAGDNLQLREHESDELAHYATEGAGTSDVEYRFPFTAPGFGELEGIAHRTNYDLRQHANHCGKADKLKYFDQQRRAHYFPHVIEPSAGADRGVLALLCEAYTPDDTRPSKVYMNFTPRMAPIKAGVFPLVNKDGMPERAKAIYDRLRRRFPCQYDAKQNIGKRYARMDEAGTPYCFTVDAQTLEDGTVTVRERNTQEQTRISEDRVEAFLAEKVGG